MDQCDNEDDNGDCPRDANAHPLQPKLLTLELQPALLILRLEPKSLLQQPIIGRPLSRIAQESVSGDNLPESRQSVWIVGVNIGMGRPDGFAECLFEGFIVCIRRNTKQIVERVHRYASSAVVVIAGGSIRRFFEPFVIAAKALFIATSQFCSNDPQLLWQLAHDRCLI